MSASSQSLPLYVKAKDGAFYQVHVNPLVRRKRSTAKLRLVVVNGEKVGAKRS